MLREQGSGIGDQGEVLVTGGSGYVAGWCIVRLLEQGYSVRATLRSLSRESALRDAVARHVDLGDRLTCVEADLLRDEGWDPAMAGFRYVLHVASPLGGKATDDREALIAAAREGTLRVLRAAKRAGVGRVVMTSAAATARPPLDIDRMSDETVWADPADPQFDAYRVSKILAERAAWDEIAAGKHTTELTTILPGAVFGPVLAKDQLGSVGIISRLLGGKPPAIPRLGFWIVDVRDLADLHIRAMTTPEAAGQRFIATGDFLWMEDIAKTLRSELGDRGRAVPQRRMPDFVFRLVALVARDLRSLAPLLGRRTAVTSEKARRLLGFAPRPPSITILDTATSLLS